MVGSPIRRSGATGRIAIDNAQAQPRRTASTASALMIGLALVSAIGVLGASTTASTDAVIDDVVKADFIATNASFLPISPEVAKSLAATPGVGAVSRVQAIPARVSGARTSLTVVDPATITRMLSITMQSGSLGALGSGELLVDDKTAAERASARRQHRPRHVPGREPPAHGERVYGRERRVLRRRDRHSTARAVGARDVDQAVYVRTSAGADPAAVRKAVDQTLTGYPNIKILDQSQFKQSIREQMDQLLYGSTPC